MTTVFTSSTETGTAARPDPGPVSPSWRERIAAMDVLRGFALIGILLMNIEWFNRAIASMGHIDRSLTGMDFMAGWLVRVLVEGKFYKLFALLFGMGFAVMLTRAAVQQRPFAAMFSRRMAALFVFGLLHATLFWTGDILRAYALGGFLLLGWLVLLRKPLLQRFNNHASQLKFSLGVMMLPLLLMFSFGTYYALTHDNATMTEQWQERLETEKRADVLLAEAKAAGIDLAAEAVPDAVAAETEVDLDTLAPEQRLQQLAQDRAKSKATRAKEEQAEISAMTQPAFWVATAFRLEQTLEEMKILPILVLLDLFPLFLFGYWLVASGKMTQIEQHLPLFRSMAYVGLAVGMAISVVAVVIMSHPAARHVQMLGAAGNGLFQLGQPLLAAGYLGAVVMAMQSASSRKWLLWLAPLGRMTLTNYLMHSVLLSVLFYGYGFGQFGQISRAPQMLIVVAIIAAQWLFSRWWLGRFRHGPLEWLWRCLTHWQWQPLRLAPASTAVPLPA